MSDFIDPVIRDDFFSDPDKIRQFALQSANFWPSDVHILKGKWPGKRSFLLQWINSNILTEFVGELFDVLGLDEQTPARVGVHYSYCTADTPASAVHRDLEVGKAMYTHVGLVYLTPNPLPDSGTKLYTPKREVGGDGWSPELRSPDNHYVKQDLENKYNRLVVYDPREFHNASGYFGTTIDDARLFLVFFMHVNKEWSAHALPRPVNPYASVAKHRIVLPNYDKPDVHDACYCGSGKDFGSCCGESVLDRAPPHGMKVFHNALSDDSAQLLLSLSGQPSQTQLVDTPQARQLLQTVDEFDGQQAMNDGIKAMCQQQITDAFGFSVEWFEHPRVQVYAPGSALAIHSDSELLNANTGLVERLYNRDICIFIFLNDDYIGGGLFFEYFNYQYRPRKGDMLVCPADQRFRYGCPPVQQGNAAFISTWAVIDAGLKSAAALPSGAVRV